MITKDIIIADINFTDIINTIIAFVLRIFKNEFSEVFDVIG